MTSTTERTRPDRTTTDPDEDKNTKEQAEEAKEAVTDRLERLRREHPKLDHTIRMIQHYGRVKGNNQAGAVTFFGFLSFFPILALAFFVIGYVAELYPDAQSDLTDAINQVLPGMVGEGEGQISLSSIQSAAGAVGIIGLLGVIYSGLGWLSALRDALLVVFEMPQKEQPNFVIGKLRDLMTLAVIGVTLVLSVAVSGAVTGYSQQLLDLFGLGSELSWLLTILSVAIGLAANTLLFFVIFQLLARPETPTRSLWQGALLGAVGFEILKWASNLLMGATKESPAFQAFGIALILLVWINYFSRVVMYAAAWAHTSRAARAQRGDLEAAASLRGDGVDLEKRVRAARAAGGAAAARSAANAADGSAGPNARLAFAGGAATMLALIAMVRRRR